MYVIYSPAFCLISPRAAEYCFSIVPRKIGGLLLLLLLLLFDNCSSLNPEARVFPPHREELLMAPEAGPLAT